ncbi:hypothetical protein CRU99_03495 [Malaciobacter mytili]|uniref:DUF262 domain-containing protein n=1 Tax=Malaciobacter mytili TaxID=603050 RepID=UPI00100B6BD4|nr:DUF262 domain-containing protein [Malaciobacter mytili]RXI45773.1 hypothetical protein CRU99_03495 [Malaciobacter mytili]
MYNTSLLKERLHTIGKYKIIKIAEFINISNLNIPEYQRPYKWTIKNINQLIDDILNFREKSSYRFGTIVLNKIKDDNNNEILNIVDGQQRTISLFLILLALYNSKKINEFNNTHKKIDTKIKSELRFKNKISKYNIQQNYQEIFRRVKNEFDEHIMDFIIDRCEVVLVIIDDISETFQFFDSQNSRGKDLAPHDLLKAYHLREMIDNTETEKITLVKIWEEMDQFELADLFNNILYRIRNWSKGNSAKIFTKNDVDMFKGITINSKTKYLDPYAKIYQMANVFVDNYNKNSDRQIDFSALDYPFQLDLPILNGKRFFEMISYYKNKYKDFETENNIIKILNSKKYLGRNRTGDKYIRILFDCALIFYVDKFGNKGLNEVINKLFVWAYKKRLEMQAVYLETIDNYARKTDIFKVIRDATSYKEIVNIQINEIVEIRTDRKKMGDIIIEIKKLGYYNGK